MKYAQMFETVNRKNRFVAYIDAFLPNWRSLKTELNRLPVSHVDWGD